MLPSEYAEAWSNLGYTYRKQGQFDKAVRAYKKAITFHYWMPDQVRHDGQRLNIFLNYDTVWQAGAQETQYFLDSHLRGNDKCG